MISFLCLLIGVGSVVYICRPLFIKRDDKKIQKPKGKGRHAVLLEHRDSLYSAIRELEFDHRMGKVEDQDYRRMREDYTQRAATVLKELDRSDGRSRIAGEIEREVAAARKKSHWKGQGGGVFCTSCGARVKGKDRFCAQCGSKIEMA